MSTARADKAGIPIERRHVSWLLFSRFLITTLFLGGTIVYQWRSLSFSQPQIPLLYALTALTYVQTVISALLLSNARRLRQFVQVQVGWDLLLALLIIYLTGGLESQFSFLYILIIFSASIFLPRRDVIIVAAASAILYGSLLDLQYFQYLPPLWEYAPPQLIDGGEVLYAVFINVSAFFLVAILSAQLSERGRRSEIALEKKAIDFDELENLNRTILANINSGLMLINRSGRIRSYNAAAIRITGYALEDIYDRDVREIFTGFDVYADGEFNVISRGQGSFVGKEGQDRTLGFTSTLVSDADGVTIGLLVVFQDLTEFLEMEDQLQRADRLAAVGRLASGMAHEIRNPLASISGSVQLLMEDEDLPEEDRRLMGIVIREADRLNKLLTDFLSFAKPARPEPTEFDIYELLQELVEMIRGDRRFVGISIDIDCRPDRTVYADRSLIRQVLWDLAINAAEAMQGQGAITIGLLPDLSVIYVQDSGPGIPAEIRGKVFEPFFTTKNSGTGLGLATVYSIVEAHGGQIDVETNNGDGTRFVISLPAKRSSYAIFTSGQLEEE
ncbi:MAG: PAS domain-containing sensor histidine kinase [Desulfuromonas sp.]|nr:MAG: PAS domain-containing sensor histidine kinase [Desulfuromonas sp.]